MKKLALVTTLLLGISPLVLAQSNVNTVDENQLKQKLQQQGYTDVTLQPITGRSLRGSGSTTSGNTTSSTTGSGTSSAPTNPERVFQGTGMKDGKQVHFEIDGTNGQITQQP